MHILCNSSINFSFSGVCTCSHLSRYIRAPRAQQNPFSVERVESVVCTTLFRCTLLERRGALLESRFYDQRNNVHYTLENMLNQCILHHGLTQIIYTKTWKFRIDPYIAVQQVYINTHIHIKQMKTSCMCHVMKNS